MNVRRYACADKDTWNGFVGASKNGLFMFDRGFMEYHKDRFEDCSLLFYEGDRLISLLPASVKDGVLTSHAGLTYGGFVTGNEMKQHYMNDCVTSLKAWACENGIREIVYKAVPHIYHRQPAEEDLHSLFCNKAQIEKIEAATVINLKNRLKMPKGRKAQVTRARREGVIFEESLDFDSFITLENEVLAEHHNATAVHTGAELSLLHERFPEQIKLYVGRYGGEIIAGCVVFVYDNLVHTQYLAANDLAREIGALDFVIFNLIEMYAPTKTWFDFGKSTEGDGTFLNEGLIAQKEGFGGRTVVYQTWRMTT